MLSLASGVARHMLRGEGGAHQREKFVAFANSFSTLYPLQKFFAQGDAWAPRTLPLATPLSLYVQFLLSGDLQVNCEYGSLIGSFLLV